MVLVGMLILGMSEVNAQNLPKNGDKVNIKDLKANAAKAATEKDEDKAKEYNRYYIRYSQDYLACSNLYCAQKGQHLWSSRHIL